MKIAGMIALNRFPLWEQTCRQLAELCDVVAVRFDGRNGDPEILQKLPNVLGKKLGPVVVADGWAACPEWREECLRLLDDVRPDVVLCPDEDEMFSDDLRDELEFFWRSDKLGMMFGYERLASNDGREINRGAPYPPDPHMKAFRWRKMLTYYPYHGNAMLATYHRPDTQWLAVSKIRHYCAFTREMESAKNWRSDTPRGRANKVVTLLGFGATGQSAQLEGEVWSCNNCYDGFSPAVMKRTTRIFEMHKFEKRERTKSKDGRPHFAVLNMLGELGHRIIMQAPHPRIVGSETFPVDEIVAQHGLDWFMGTPCYMLAMAIHERYTRIMIYGIDQMDWEHVLQRECFGCWVGYGLGLGIQIGGRLTFLERHGGKRYGYDWGPEWDDSMNKMLWAGHPIEINYSKIEPHSVIGDLTNPVTGKKGA